MKIEVNGVQYTNFTEAECVLRLEALTNTFKFVAATTEAQPLPFKGGDKCKIIVDEEPVLTGNIEVIKVSYDAGEHEITIEGRDKTGDLLDSSIDSLSDIRINGLTLKLLIEKIIAHLKLDIKVIDEVSPKTFSVEDIAAPEPGDNAFQFIEKHAKKRNVLLTSNADGDIVIASNSGEVAEGAIQHIIGAEDNNVMSSEFSYDTTGRFNLYKIRSSLSPAAISLNAAGEITLGSVVSQSGSATDENVREGRQIVINAEATSSNSHCAERAKWEADVRKARGLVYSATVPLYRVGGDEGDLWNINKVYQIKDDFLGKVEPMLANAVKYTFNVDEGRNTKIDFVSAKAYLLDLEDDPLVEVATNVV